MDAFIGIPRYADRRMGPPHLVRRTVRSPVHLHAHIRLRWPEVHRDDLDSVIGERYKDRTELCGFLCKNIQWGHERECHLQSSYTSNAMHLIRGRSSGILVAIYLTAPGCILIL